MSAPDDSRPASLSEAVPSSFDDNPEFFEEARAQKLWRKLKQEPLIPLGCVATCYALYQATKSIRHGDHHQTNKMFRARIYAQGFTLIALVAGSIFYKDERLRRKSFEGAIEEKKAAEKREKWLRELEVRDDEERAWRQRVEASYQTAKDAGVEVKNAIEDKSLQVKKAVEDTFSTKSIKEQVTNEGWGPGMWVMRTRNAWKRI